MKERPIIFNDEMVRAVLDGKKTQTRRVIKQQPSKRSNHIWANGNQFAFCEGTHDKGARCEEDSVIKSPYGVPGDRLWVREIFVLESNRDVAEISDYKPPFNDGRPIDWKHNPETMENYWTQPHYRATDPKPDLVCAEKDGPDCIWRPQLHMSRWASRILLEIEEVRVERVQDITDKDAMEEGLWETSGEGLEKMLSNPTAVSDYTVREKFKRLWDSINKNKSGRTWEDNPWVWVVTFRRM